MMYGWENMMGGWSVGVFGALWLIAVWLLPFVYVVLGVLGIIKLWRLIKK